MCVDSAFRVSASMHCVLVCLYMCACFLCLISFQTFVCLSKITLAVVVCDVMFVFHYNCTSDQIRICCAMFLCFFITTDLQCSVTKRRIRPRHGVSVWYGIAYLILIRHNSRHSLDTVCDSTWMPLYREKAIRQWWPNTGCLYLWVWLSRPMHIRTWLCNISFNGYTTDVNVMCPSLLHIYASSHSQLACLPDLTFSVVDHFVFFLHPEVWSRLIVWSCVVATYTYIRRCMLGHLLW